MHLNQLWVFYQVAKHKSFSQAAEALFLSQPSVSNQVKLLEESCGLKLFDRSGRSVELTNTGEILLSYAERIFNLAKEADSVIEEIKGLKAGGIRISASNTLGAYYLPDILDLFRKKHPQIEIRMNVGYTQTVAEDILAFRSDLGLIGQGGRAPEHRRHPPLGGGAGPHRPSGPSLRGTPGDRPCGTSGATLHHERKGVRGA